MEIDTYDHGVFSWVDVTATDFDASAKFYSRAVRLGDRARARGVRRLLDGRRERAADVAGSPRRCPPRRPRSGPPMSTSRASTTRWPRRPRAEGSVIAEPMDVGEAGRMAVFADPEGARHRAMAGQGDHKGAGLVNESNTWAWSELMCDDPEKEKEFYAGVFGWGEVTHGEGDNAPTPSGRWTAGRSAG